MSFQDFWRNGIVFVKKNELDSALRWYLEHDEERHDIARRGRELLRSMRMEDMIRDPVRDLINDRCNV